MHGPAGIKTGLGYFGPGPPLFVGICVLRGLQYIAALRVVVLVVFAGAG